jgi:hypothetical protein
MEWYARSHAAKCVRCGRFLSRLTAMLGRLKGLKETPAPEEHLDAAKWEEMESRFAEVER